jgi:hypothetical protein
MGTGVTIAVVGKISTADVADPGIVIVTGNIISTSTGQSVTLTLTATPTANTSTGSLTWPCLDTPQVHAGNMPLNVPNASI